MRGMGKTSSSSGSLALGPLESEIMYLVWDLGEATVRDVYQALLSRREIAYTTVMTVMSKLAGKGVLNRRRQGLAYVYTPAVSRDEFTRNKIDEVVESMLGWFTEPAMSYLVDRMAKIDPQRLAELGNAIARLREKKKKEFSGD